MREISLLQELKKFTHVIKLLDVIKEEDHPKKLMHCVFEYCPTTLSRVIGVHYEKKDPF